MKKNYKSGETIDDVINTLFKRIEQLEQQVKKIQEDIDPHKLYFG